MATITITNGKINDGRSPDNGVNGGTAIILDTTLTSFAYSLKNMVSADPVPNKEVSSTQKYGIAQVDKIGMNNPIITITGTIDVDDIASNEITLELIKDIARVRYDGTATTAIILNIQSGKNGASPTDIKNYNSSSTNIRVILDSVDVRGDQTSEQLHLLNYTLNFIETE